MVDRGLDLGVQGASHFPLGVSPVEAESEDKDDYEDEANSNHMFHSVPVIHVHDTNFDVVLDVPGVQDLMTDSWSVLETSTDGVENGLGFKLASVGGVVDDDRWEQTGAVFAPVVDVLINESIRRAKVIPFRFVLCAKTFFNAFLGSIPVKSFDKLVAISFGADFVDLGVTVHMDCVHVVPESLPCSARCVSLFVNAHLSQIFQHDLLASKTGLLVRRAVFSASEAVLLHVLFITVLAFPEDESWSHQDLFSEFSVELHEVLDEVKGQVDARRVPDVVLDAVVRSLHFEIGEHHHLGQFLVGGVLQPVDELFAVLLGNEERWNSEACASSVVRHDDIVDVLLRVVDDDSNSDTSIFHVLHLFGERATTSVSDHEWNSEYVFKSKILFLELLLRERLAKSVMGLIEEQSSHL